MFIFPEIDISVTERSEVAQRDIFARKNWYVTRLGMIAERVGQKVGEIAVPRMSADIACAFEDHESAQVSEMQGGKSYALTLHTRWFLTYHDDLTDIDSRPKVLSKNHFQSEVIIEGTDYPAPMTVLHATVEPFDLTVAQPDTITLEQVEPGAESWVQAVQILNYLQVHQRELTAQTS